MCIITVLSLDLLIVIITCLLSDYAMKIIKYLFMLPMVMSIEIIDP